MRITWDDKSNTKDPAPKMNLLEHYINRSRVPDIQKAYNDAILEYVSKYNEMNEKIIKLNKELEVWKKNQHGRKSSLDQQKKNFIDEQKLKGVSNRSIAKMLNLSEGTIRNYLKSKNIKGSV